MRRIAIIGNGGGGKSTRSSGSPAGGAHRLMRSRRPWKAGRLTTPGSSMASGHGRWSIGGWAELTRSCTWIFRCARIFGGLRSGRCSRSCEVRLGPDKSRARPSRSRT